MPLIDGERVQRLIRLLALCQRRDRATHIGFARVRGRGATALHHLVRVNGWTIEQARKHDDAAYARWEERSRFTWTIDLSMIVVRTAAA